MFGSKEQNANDRLMRVFNFLLVGGIIMTVTVLFVSNFIMPQSDRTVAVAMSTMRQNFSDRLLTVHNLWTVEHSSRFVPPKWIGLFNGSENEKLGFDPDKVVFNMSSSGWIIDVDGFEGQERCEKIWRTLLGKEMKLYLTPVKTIDETKNSLCIYYADKSGFSYNYSNGDVAEAR